MNEEKLDAILKLMSVMHTDITVLKTDVAELKTLKTDVAELKTDVAEIKVQTAKNTKKIDKLIDHAVQTDKNFKSLSQQIERVEKQGFAIGVELKEENKTLDGRVTKLEEEVFPKLAH